MKELIEAIRLQALYERRPPQHRWMNRHRWFGAYWLRIASNRTRRLAIARRF